MHTKKTDEILSAMRYLYKQIEEIGNYPDKSLFFQDPRVIEGWLVLVRAIKQIEKSGTTEDETNWEKRSEAYVAPLLARRELFQKYKNIYRTYYDPLKQLWDGYSGWIDDGCISTDGIEALITDKYDQVLDVDDFGLHLERVNTRSIDARYAVFKTLSDIFDLLQAIMNRGGQVVIDTNPSDEDFAKAIDNDLREWTKHFGKKMFREMKEDLNRHYKTNRTEAYKPEYWGDMLVADEDALNMAKRQQLADCDAKKQEHWGEDMKKRMDENGRLMQQILSSCQSDELIDFGKTENVEPFISLLTPDNLSMFYDIIVRRNLIQCEMFPHLKEQHEKWLNPKEEQQTEEYENIGLNNARQSRLVEIIAILRKGEWKEPATAEKIELLLNAVFGRDTSLLDEEDVDNCEKMWALVEGGGGDRMVIVPANLAGFFRDENLLKGSPTEISNALFGNANQFNNINKGKDGYRSNAFEEVISFLNKYIDKIIRQG